MKRLIISLLVLFGVAGYGQTTLNLQPDTLIVCFGANARFQAYLTPDTGTFVFSWKRNGIVVEPSDSLGVLNISDVSYSDTGYYSCTATSGTFSVSSDTVHLFIKPTLNLDTLYRYNDLGCPGTCKGQMKALVSGGTPPYFYDWGAGISQDTIVLGLCKGKYLLKVTDSDQSHCIAKSYEIKVLTLPKIDFTMDPPDTVYLTKPYLNVAFPDTSQQHLTSWEWNFGDSTKVSNLNPYQHTYAKTGRFLVSLKYFDLNGCDTTVKDSITVKVAKLKIPNIFTPNGDGSNDYFVVQVEGDASLDINEIYLKTELVIVNRWGRKVFSESPYISKDKESGWDGKGVADGVYFYVLTLQGLYESEVYKGSITILR